jgi:hypothetical protein
MVEPLDVSDLIGCPFVAGARGPDAYDCYGLVRELYRRAHGVEIPNFVSPDGLLPSDCASMFERERTRPLWAATECAEGVIALLRVDGFASHVGFMLADHLLCHTWRDAGGVCIEPIERWQHRLVGFYRYAG